MAIKKLFASMLVVALLLAVPFAEAAPPGQGDSTPQTITVTGYGLAYGAPDIAIIGLGVEVSDANVTMAMNRANEQMQAVMDALMAAGVAAEDIRTEQFSIYQDYNYGMPAMDAGSGSDIQYHVSNVLRITVRDTNQVGELLAAAVSAGANLVHYVQFDIDNRTSLESQARGLAVDDARARANELAGMLGLTVGQPLKVSEGMDTYTIGVDSGGSGYAMASVPSISQGMLSVSMAVTITFSVE